MRGRLPVLLAAGLLLLGIVGTAVRLDAPADGSSLRVDLAETYEIAFVADNPGVWVDHCHNLPHAAQGLIVHLAYAGVSTPFLVGGPAGNVPE